MRALRVAIGFLTRIPVSVAVEEADDMARSVPAFALVGAGVGVLTGGVLQLTALAAPTLVAAVLAVAFELMVTGAFHHDGLADTFDSIGAGSDRERALDIMKDSRLGTYGVAALSLSLLLRVVLYSEIVSMGPVPILAAFGAASRGITVGSLLMVAPARAAGLGTSYLAHVTPRRSITGLLIGLVIAFALLRTGALLPLSVSVLAVLLTALWANRNIGGVTGDVLGSFQQVAELGAIATVAMMAS